jgi:hypothetical protein
MLSERLGHFSWVALRMQAWLVAFGDLALRGGVI